MLDKFEKNEVMALIALCLFVAGFQLPLALLRGGISYDIVSVVAYTLWALAFLFAIIAVTLWVIRIVQQAWRGPR